MEVPVELLEAQAAEHRLEIAKREMQLVRYRLVLEQHGIPPPDADGEELLEMWRECRHVISTASQFVMKLGTGKELLVDWETNGRPKAPAAVKFVPARPAGSLTKAADAG